MINSYFKASNSLTVSLQEMLNMIDIVRGEIEADGRWRWYNRKTSLFKISYSRYFLALINIGYTVINGFTYPAATKRWIDLFLLML